jgi:poly(A) polymerase
MLDTEAGAAPPAVDVSARTAADRDRLIHRDNTFGTPEEDAFRRDFTVNALFYDIATFSIIDYVGGLADLQARLIRCIGDPDERLQEDPVRMVRAVSLAARLDFTIDPPIFGAIARHRHEIARSAPARLLEECYKILRAGAAERAFRLLADTGLLAHIAPAFGQTPPDGFWQALARLDAHRRRSGPAPDALPTTVLIGTLLAPLGFSERRPPRDPGDPARRRAPAVDLSPLPVARRDLEQLRQILLLQPRLCDLKLSHRAQRALLHRSTFKDAVTWLEIHGEAPDVVAHWRHAAGPGAPPGEEPPPARPRRRRRRLELNDRNDES